MKRLLLTLLFACTTVLSPAQTTEELSALYRDGKYAEVIASCNKLLKADPANAEASLLLGRSYADQNNTVEAIAPLKQAAKADGWVKSWAYAYLGVCAFRSDDQLTSRAYLDSAIQLNATKNCTSYALKRKLTFGFDDAYASFQVYTSPHFRFHFQDSLSEEACAAYAKIREAAYDSLNQFFKAVPPKKIDFFVWFSRDTAMQILFSPPGFSNPEECLIHALAQQTPGHELTHVLLVNGLHPSYKTRLINEGVATLCDQTNRDYLKLAQAAVKRNGAAVSIAFLWENGKEATEELIYPVGAAWLDFLRKHLSEEQFKALLKDQRYSSAQALLKGKLDDWMKEFEGKLNQL